MADTFIRTTINQQDRAYRDSLVSLSLCTHTHIHIISPHIFQNTHSHTHVHIFYDYLSLSLSQGIMLYLTYDQLSWEFEEAPEDGEDFYSSLWLEFDSVLELEDREEKVTKRVQIFSRQVTQTTHTYQFFHQ